MKKNYIAPQTEAIQLLGENAIMAGSPTVGGGKFISTGAAQSDVYGD
ncbi:MAG: hypothetical protein IKY87_03485 [Paludibacteraceae bacterium]|nr:hypothetical protein [Paludibacteraceae bacterium]